MPCVSWSTLHARHGTEYKREPGGKFPSGHKFSDMTVNHTRPASVTMASDMDRSFTFARENAVGGNHDVCLWDSSRGICGFE